MLPFLSQLLAEILNDISLLIPLSPSAAHSNAMAVPSEAPDIRYNVDLNRTTTSEGAHVARETTTACPAPVTTRSHTGKGSSL